MSTRLCSVDGCGRMYRCSGYCKSHYDRFLAHGDPGPAHLARIGTIIDCVQCGTPFSIRAPHAKYCSKKCNMRAFNGYRGECSVDGCTRQYEEGSDICAVHARAKAVLAAGEKVCRKCGDIKRLDEFSEHPTGIAGRNSNCRDCACINARESAERAGPEALRAYQREYGKRPGARSADVARTQKRRAKMRSAFVEDVDRMKVYWSHLGKCGICGEIVPLDDFHVDHIVPLARGGEHSYANTQPAHPVCNLRKGARTDTEVAA